jgi:hypothetical protein
VVWEEPSLKNAAAPLVTEHLRKDITRARTLFERNEPRDLFYRAATYLIAQAHEGKTPLSIAEAVAVLLQTWNRMYFRFHKFNFEKLERLCQEHQLVLAKCAARAIDSLKDDDKAVVSHLFQAFEKVLGPVGAAKALHLLAPRFFPLWDRSIAAAYRIPLGKAGSNGNRYWSFMLKIMPYVRALRVQMPECSNPLKSIDEYNYCKYTKHWMA